MLSFSKRMTIPSVINPYLATPNFVGAERNYNHQETNGIINMSHEVLVCVRRCNSLNEKLTPS